VKVESFAIASASAGETEAFGERLGRLLAGGETICLCGQLGAGKTVLVRGLARGLGCPAGEVASPTYVLERNYRGGRLLLRHLDAYRLSGAEEFEAADLAVPGPAADGAGAVSVLEWADRVTEALPPERLDVNISVAADGQRRLELKARGAGPAGLLERLAAQ
jgi:tRNA threonylcarbamoyladenosine biosynthesis protein TsaE